MWWSWFEDKSEEWGAADIALVLVASGLAAGLVLGGVALVLWAAR